MLNAELTAGRQPLATTVLLHCWMAKLGRAKPVLQFSVLLGLQQKAASKL